MLIGAKYHGSELSPHFYYFKIGLEAQKFWKLYLAHPPDDLLPSFFFSPPRRLGRTSSPHQAVFSVVWGMRDEWA
jgi:hypothetical protein